MKKIIFGAVLMLWTIIVVVSINLYNKDFAKKSDIRQFYQTANRIDNKDDFDYLLETKAGHSIIQTELSAVDSVSLNQVTSGKQFAYISATYQEYLPHTEIYTVTVSDGKGKSHTETRTRIVWRWDTVGNDTNQAKNVSFFKNKYSANLFLIDRYEKGIPLKDLFKDSNDNGNIQSTGFHKRTIWRGVPDKFQTTFYADLSDKGFAPVQFPNQKRDEQIRLHENQPIKTFLGDELKANTPHPIIWSIVTIIIMIIIGICGIAVYIEVAV